MEKSHLIKLTKEERKHFMKTLAHYYTSRPHAFSKYTDQELIDECIKIVKTWRLYE